MRNLLDETLKVLKQNGKSEKDILWVGTEKYYVDWDVFMINSDVEYNAGYGGQEVATNLLVVGKNWWMERHEYDGSEWWEFKSLPKKPRNKIKKSNIKFVAYDRSWISVESLNGLDGGED